MATHVRFQRKSDCDTLFHHPENPEIIRNGGSGFGTRHVQCFMVFLGCAAGFGMRINLSVAIVSMVPKRNEIGTPLHPVLPWSEQMQGSILSSFFWGYMVSQIPGGQLAQKFGPKSVLTASIFSCGIITILTPLAAIYGGFYCMIIARVAQGLLQGLIYPTIACFLSRWAASPEKGRLAVWVLNGGRLGGLSTPAVAGILADSRWGWPSIFYVTGGISVLWALLFFYIGSSSPQEHKTISESEKMYILNSLPSVSTNRKGLKTPWKAIMTSGPVWALIIATFSDHWGFYTLLTQIPRYINGVFGFNIKDSGYLSALPFGLAFILAYVYAAINDALINKNILSRTAAKKLWNSVALWGPAFSLCLVAFFGTNRNLVLLLLISSISMNAAAYLGVFSNHIDLSPNFAGSLSGITQELSLIAPIAAPIYVGYIVSDRTSVAQWQIVFLTSAAVFFVGNLIFVLFGSAEVQSWNAPSAKNAQIRTEEKERQCNEENVNDEEKENNCR